MLVLTRRLGEAFQIGENVTVRVLKSQGSRIRIGIEAPGEIKILRLRAEDLERKPAARVANLPAPEHVSGIPSRMPAGADLHMALE